MKPWTPGFPCIASGIPDVDRAQIVAHLASLVDERRRRGFPDDERPAPPAIPDTAVLFESPLARRRIRGILDTPFATTSGVAKASAFKLIDLETQSKADTQDLHTFSPLGGPGGSSFEGAHGAFFWTGFSRLDSTWDQINIFEGSPSDRVVHMAVVQINLPPPTTRVIARIRTSMFINLAQGVEIINDWGRFDDEDDASLKIDFCGAFTRDGLGFAGHRCRYSQVPTKGRLHVHGVFDCARLLVRKPFARGGCCFPANCTASAPRNSTRFAAQYPARGIPCERFELALAGSPRITRGRRGWLGPTP